MKLSELKVGMIVKHACWGNTDYTASVLCVGEKQVFLRGEDGDEFARDYQSNWTEIKPAKKPSERIHEIIGPTRSDPEWQEKAIDAILKFLDEREAEDK